MPYEATVPVHRRLLWPAVIDPERLLGALPNAVIDASGNQGVAGRLRVRMREQTVTFRGIARIIEVIPASLRVTLEVEATFGRSGGAVEGVVEITLRPAGSGTRAVVGGSLHLADDSSPLPPGDAVDAALGRIVRRWFAALAENSPAGPRADLPEAPPAVPEPVRAPERAPLAVVRDIPPPDSVAIGAAAVANAHDTDVEIEDTGDDAESAGGPDAGADSASGSDPGSGSASHTGTDAGTDQGEARRTDSAGPKSAASQVQLRLVSSREGGDPEDGDPAEPGAGSGGGQRARSARPDEGPDQSGSRWGFEQGPDSGVDTAEDIWSRLRDRGLPRWIPVVVSAAIAALTTAVLLIAILRRRYRRRVTPR